MKQIRLEGPRRLACVEVDKPVPQEGEALVKIVACGICGSDVNAFRGTNSTIAYPLVIGHELAGLVESIPENNKYGLRPGDRVIVNPNIYCGHCYPCSIGRTNCCTSLKVLGARTDGAMAEYFCHPADMLFKIPDSMSWEEAAMAEPLTIGIHGARRAALKAGEYCAILGAGPIGVLSALVAQAYGAFPILINPSQKRLDFAKSIGIEHIINSTEEDAAARVAEITGGEMAHVVMECSGAPAAVRQTIDLVRNAGRITLTGWPKTEVSLPTDLITRKEVDVRGSRVCGDSEFLEAIDLISSKRVDIMKILTKTVTLDEAIDTIKDIDQHSGNYTKVVVRLA